MQNSSRVKLIQTRENPGLHSNREGCRWDEPIGQCRTQRARAIAATGLASTRTKFRLRSTELRIGVPTGGKGRGEGRGEEHDAGHTRKISGLIFDHFDDPEAFVLDAGEHSEKFTFNRVKSLVLTKPRCVSWMF